jgi:hypothetical protein
MGEVEHLLHVNERQASSGCILLLTLFLTGQEQRQTMEFSIPAYYLVVSF